MTHNPLCLPFQAMIELGVLPTCLDLFFKVNPYPYKRERVCVREREIERVCEREKERVGV